MTSPLPTGDDQMAGGEETEEVPFQMPTMSLPMMVVSALLICVGNLWLFFLMLCEMAYDRFFSPSVDD